MRVALCISGQPRFLHECFPSIKKNIIDVNETDVFFHSWDCDSYGNEPYKYGGDGGWKNQRIPEGAHKEAIDLYDPVSYIIEPQINFKNDCIDYAPTAKKYLQGAFKEAKEAGVSEKEYLDRLKKNSLSMWYSIFQSNHLKERHAMTNGFIYDFVIRCRFDVKIGSPILCSSLDPAIVYYQGMSHPAGLVSDWVNVGSSANMNVHATTYFNFHKIYNDAVATADGALCNELALGVTLARAGIPVMPVNWNLDLPRF